MYRTRRLSGFTLIEILMVIAIIGIISILSIGPIRSAQQRSRDAQRKADINILAQALELYYSENRSLPMAVGNTADCDYKSTDAAPWIPGLTQRYLPSSNGKVLPLDPLKDDSSYFYTYTNYLIPSCQAGAGDGQTFKLEAVLENKKDNDAVVGGGGTAIYEVAR